VATGLLWTPCAGPVLGLILSGAALSGPGPQTSALLLAYGLGAATSLAAALLAGRQILARLRPSLLWVERARRLAGAAVVGSVVLLGLGLDTSLLQRLSAEQTAKLENTLVTRLTNPLGGFGQSTEAAVPDTLSGPAGCAARQAGLDQRAAASRRSAARQGRRRQFLDLFLHQLPARPAASEGLGRHIQGAGPRRHRCPHAGIRLRAGSRQCGRSQHALGVRYPVVLDNDFRIWRAFGNSGWPGIHIVGADGRVRHQATGEGRYDQSEQVIRRLLAEANARSARRWQAAGRRPGHPEGSRLGQSALARNLSGP
jgi:hypothetical protein